MSLKAFALIFVFSLLMAGCTDDSSDAKVANDQPPEIVTVNYPLFYFTQQLAGDLANVTLPIPADIDPAQWQPNIDEILKLQQAELIILNGAGYSSWLNKVSLPSRQLLNTSTAIKEQWIALDQQTTHSHGPTGAHSHSGYAFTTWMDITIASQQAQSIAAALVARWPEQKTVIEPREQALLSALDKLDRSYQDAAQCLAGYQRIYSHPVYQYFERRYQLPGTSLHWEPGQMPSDAQWQQLQEMIDGSGPGVFIWEDTPDPVIAERMSSMGLEFITLKPAANRSERDWLGEQESNLQQLQKHCIEKFRP